MSLLAFDDRLIALFEDGRIYVRSSSEPEDDAWALMDDPDEDRKVIEEAREAAKDCED